MDLVRLPLESLERQLGDLKRTLEDRLGRSVSFLAPPYGRVDRRVIDVAHEVGYQAVCSSVSWPMRPGSRIVNRVVVYRHTTGRDFSRLLEGHPVPYAARATRAALLYWPKRLLLRPRHA